MWSVICFILLLIIGVIVGSAVLWLAWQIVRFVLNLICYIFLGQDEVF